MKEKHAGGTPEKSMKSKSPDKPQAAIETVEKTGATEDTSEKKQSVTKEATDKQGKWKLLWASISQETDFFDNTFVGQDYRYICYNNIDAVS